MVILDGEGHVSTQSSVKKFTVSVRKWVFDEYLQQKSNRSAFIEEMILKGIESQYSENMNYKSQILTLNNTLREREEEIKKLKANLGRFKHVISPQLQEKLNFARSMRNQGMLH